MSVVGFLPTDTPWQGVVGLLTLAPLIGLVRAVMPRSSSDRVKWWENFWNRRK